MLLRRFYYDKLAQASYMVGCQVTREALVVDPHRDAREYLEAAEAEGLTIRYVAETHIHADYLSGSRALAAKVGAELLLSGEGDETWQYRFAESDRARLLRAGDRLQFGNVLIDVWHTPGHTPEHLSFLITDGAMSSHPMAMLTGDFVFVGDVGRPDLLEKAGGLADTMEVGARDLFASLQRLAQLPDYLQILPGHGAGSACGKALGAVPTTTLGYERLVSWAFQCESEDDFVAKVLEDQPEPPTYFAKMKQLNRDGPPITGLPTPARLDPASVGDVVSGEEVVIDTRSGTDFARGHIPGTLSVSLADDFPENCGWLVPYDRRIYLIAVDQDAATEAARDLSFIGLDALEGFFGPEALDEWRASQGDLQATAGVDWPEAERAVAEDAALLLDVRGLAEWSRGHVLGAEHAFLGSLRQQATDLPRDRPLIFYCQKGKRSQVAASLLQAEGFDDVRSVVGGISARPDGRPPLVGA